VLLLLFPADRLLSAQVELRTFESFRSLENSPRFRPWWWVPALWLDPVRGFFGAYLVRHGLLIGSNPWALVSKTAYAVLLGLLTAAVIIQMFTRRGDRTVLLAPLGFVAGVVLALTMWPVALIAIVAALLGLFACRQFHAFFAFGPVAVALLGFTPDAHAMWVAPAAGIFALPLIAGILTGTTLELPTRNSSRPTAPGPQSA
jgi:hypothetical protein